MLFAGGLPASTESTCFDRINLLFPSEGLRVII